MISFLTNRTSDSLECGSLTAALRKRQSNCRTPKRFALLFACLTSCSATSWAESPRAVLKQGIAAAAQNGSNNFARAASLFEQAAEAAEDRGLDPAVAVYNRAHTQLELGKAEAAAMAYAEAMLTENLELQQKAFYGRGNALMSLSQAQEAQNQVSPAVKSVEEAIDMYMQAMLMDPRDQDPKVNYELAQRRLEQLKQLEQEQQEQQEQQQDEEKNEDEESEQQQQEQEQEGNEDEQQQDNQSQPDEQEQDQESDESEQEQQQDPSSDQQQNQQPGEAGESREMSEEEAEMLLNAMREEEDAARRQYQLQQGQPREVEKDW